ncbi:hypothetical protein I310_01425 [Cryptococcus deuterogattii CA1014]|nr:hypothetical protein I310_01425 [Cryptococcus deuterogattii CA1014]
MPLPSLVRQLLNKFPMHQAYRRERTCCTWQTHLSTRLCSLQQASAAIQPSVNNARARSPLEQATGPPPTTQYTLDMYFTAPGENGHYQAFSGKHMPSPSSHEHSIDEVKKAEISNGASASSSKTVVNKAIPAPNPVVDMSTIRSLIDTEILKKSNSPGSLFKHLRMRGEDDKELPSFTPNPDELLEILIQLRDHAPGAYLAKMADNDRYVQVWQKWLKQCRKEPEVWEKIMVPLLEISLVQVPFRQLSTSIPGTSWQYTSDIKKPMLRRKKTSQLSPAVQAIKDDGKVKEESSTKRPAIKSSVSSTKTSSVSGTPKSSAKLSTVSDMSFFSAPAASQPPKPKPKPTSVSSKSAASQTPTASSTAKSFTLGNFLATMNNTQGTAQNSTTETKKESKEPRYTAKGRLIRSVRWKEDAQLEEVREFSLPAWEKELMGHGPKVSVHELDMQEVYLETSSNLPVITEEVQYQLERERGILSVQYLAGEVVPDPAEDNVRIVEDGESTRYMSPAVVVEDSQKNKMLESAPAATSVQSLLANLQGIPLQQSHILGQPHYPGAAPPAMTFTANSATPFPSYYTEQHPAGWGATQVLTSSTAGHEHYWEQRDSYDHPQSGLKGKGKKKRGSWQIEKKGTRTCQYWLQGE